MSATKVCLLYRSEAKVRKNGDVEKWNSGEMKK